VNVTVAIESPLQDDVRELVSALSAHLLPLSPREFQFGIGVEEMAEPRTTVFVARDDDGVAVGCGALTVHDGGTGEVKRMFTIPEARGARVGERVLSAIIELARRHRLDRLLLETGASQDFASAHHLYARTGFRRRGPFHDYPDSGWSAFYELGLTAGGRAEHSPAARR
jgi:putative acetyltransferase